jgi:hypothetical protein
MTTTTDKLAGIPLQMRHLKIDPVRGIPVPWFVPWIVHEGDTEEKPEFRAADGDKRVEAVTKKLCWVCGDYLGRNVTFVLGPMCGINRVTAEPPCHFECARYSATHCPFLTRPRMERRDASDIQHLTSNPGGEMIERNPGAIALWTCRDWKPFSDGSGSWLIKVGEPSGVAWFAEGRPAKRAEVEESVRTGLPLLEAMCQSPNERAALAALAEKLVPLYPEV